MSEPAPETIHGDPMDEAFNGTPYNMAMLTTLLHCYDLLTIIAMQANPERTKEMIELHRRGDFWNDPPRWAPTSWAE